MPLTESRVMAPKIPSRIFHGGLGADNRARGNHPGFPDLFERKDGKMVANIGETAAFEGSFRGCDKIAGVLKA